MTVDYEGWVKHSFRVRDLETGEVLHDPVTCDNPICTKRRQMEADKERCLSPSIALKTAGLERLFLMSYDVLDRLVEAAKAESDGENDS